jgi:hypothetical protein
MRRLLPFFLLAVALGIYFPLCQGVWESRAQSRAETPAGYLIPSKFSRILALGNQGLLSDFLFLKVATYIGGKGSAKQPMGEADWQFVASSLNVVTDLDPYFVDPYIMTEGLLTWDAGQPELANQLLIKGTKYRTDDWRLPFFIGFNHFYFLKDYEAAAGYIMTAAQLPGSPAYLQTLGARLAYYGGKSKTALLFLQQMLAENDDPLLRKRLSLRLTALERAVLIEEAVEKFKAQQGRVPNPLSELVTAGYLAELPIDPYGGQWGLVENGRVFSSSRFAEVAPVKAPKQKPE